ncbi:MAG: diaminopimelate epimerase [Woeseia sp.]
MSLSGFIQTDTRRPFIKMHGLRNHFVIVDARELPFAPTAGEIERLCDVQIGIGADQLIVIEPSNSADAFMRILNKDGREAEACGNATRCVAWLLLNESMRDTVTLETVAGLLACERAGDRRVRCEMGRVRRDWQKIPLARECDTLHLPVANGPLKDPVGCSVGNPHAVFFVESLDSIDIASLAPAIQNDQLFPQQVNVGVAEFIDPGQLRLQVYERGAGLTMACGSGACAAVFAARARGMSDADVVRVQLPGGEVEIEFDSDDVATMTGPVAYSFSGVL